MTPASPRLAHHITQLTGLPPARALPEGRRPEVSGQGKNVKRKTSDPGKARTMFQVRFHGRGGQGVVTAAELLAAAAFSEGRSASRTR
jgi:hypothetical protein